MPSKTEHPVTPPPDLPGPDAATLRVLLITVATTLFLASTGNTIVTTALPRIVSDLGGLAYISWVVTAFLLASTVGAPIAGKLGDMYGRKIVLQVAIGVFLLGGLICGVARSMEVLIAGRFVQGLGGGALIVVSMAVVADVLPPRERGRVQGALSSVFGFSTVVGPLIGGFLVQTVGWHWIFFVNFPIGVVAFVILTRTLKSSTEKVPHKMDFVGSALLLILLSSVVLIANLAGSVYAWTSLTVLFLLALAPMALVGFVSAERRAAEPVMPLDLFRIRNFQAANSVNFLVGMAMFGTIAFIPMFLQVVKHVGPVSSGLYLVAMMGGLIGTSFAAGRVISSTGRYKVMPTVSTAVLAGAMLLLTTINPETPLAVITLYLFLVGAGIGPTMSVGIVSIQSAVPREHLGVGTASANMFRLIGGAIGTSVFGALFTLGLGRHVQPLMPQVQEVRELTSAMVDRLEPAAQAAVLQGFSDALMPVYFVGAAVAAIACLASTRLVELPLGPVPRDRRGTPAE
ncbi:drug resistance transporter, EmrB/QacA family protein [Pseudooceanicola batsensis HTCC2597]|uniref:Drug resistance transporter, EmrB/QacA family protein n=1 Tax=Pseudooceanicola batsensis (strain ATCC BAA-863 / DSM 15984 / KCTC 12145 / HTCC2597) TaxID=252305 RepID=A3TZ27_PSEBH|nr:MDR family MFS transporter [Pseudooceanicola batsensis]EAQ02845.1 drug resistance transporter, EmrB/QacA family protein [Pseudooceanicola batsensis HTCC2597]